MINCLVQFCQTHRRQIKNSVILGVAIGIGIEFVVIPIIGEQSVRSIADSIADSMIRLAEHTDAGNVRTKPFVFVAIDDQSWAEWGSPLVTPRDAIATVLDKVATGNPAAIVLDIPTDTRESAESKQLRLTIKCYSHEGFQESRACKESNPPKSRDIIYSNKPPLILVRRTISPTDEKDGFPRPRKTSIDDLTRHQLKIRWGSARFPIDGDGVTRQLRLYEPVCNEQNAPELLPSVALLAAAAASGNLTTIDSKSKELTPNTCQAPLPPDEDLSVKFEEGIISLGGNGLGRIIYSIAWRPGQRALGRPVIFDRGSSATVRYVKVPLVEVRPVAEVLEAAKSADPLPGVEGRIVVIGGSFKDNLDIRHTPLGLMPGAMVIINAIHALLRYGTPRDSGWLWQIPFSLFLIIFSAGLFSILRASVAAGLVAVILIGITIVSTLFLRSGLLLALSLPSAGPLVADLVHVAFGWGEGINKLRVNKGWCVLLLRDYH